ncbi:MAG: hypothetical protein ACHP65_02750 [Legionellales bacterium]
MPRFFSIPSKTLHNCHNVQGLADFMAANIGVPFKRVVEEDVEGLPVAPKFRRSLGGIGPHLQRYFSTEDLSVLSGFFDCAHATNSDLVAIAAEFHYGLGA